MPATPVVAVLGAKGGCGRSTVAVNLTYLLAAAGQRVALVDLAQFGSLALLVGAESPVGLGPAAACLRSSLQAELPRVLEASLTPVRLGDCSLARRAAAPPQRQDDLDVGGVATVIRTLQGLGYSLVLDTSHEVSDRLAGALHTATHQLWVLSPDPAAGWHMLQALDVAEQLGAPAAPAGILVNRHHRRTGLRLADLQKVCGREIWGVLPDVPRQLPLQANLGAPLLAHRRGPWQRVLRAVLTRTGGAPATEKGALRHAQA